MSQVINNQGQFSEYGLRYRGSLVTNEIRPLNVSFLAFSTNWKTLVSKEFQEEILNSEFGLICVQRPYLGNTIRYALTHIPEKPVDFIEMRVPQLLDFQELCVNPEWTSPGWSGDKDLVVSPGQRSSGLGARQIIDAILDRVS
jgi:hypothetical protein